MLTFVVATLSGSPARNPRLAVARAVILHQWASGDAVRLSVHAEAEHPDVYDELTTRVVRMYRETVLEPDASEP